MKFTIGVLRLFGIISFMLFVSLLTMEYGDLAKVVMFFSICCFAAILLLQLYRFYAVNYLKKEERDMN